MSYKVVDEYKSFVGSYNWNHKNMRSVKIVSEINNIGLADVYNMEVEDNHNYIVCPKSMYDNFRNIKGDPTKKRKLSNDGIIVHNCDYAGKSSNQMGVFCKALKVKKLIGFTATPLVLQTSMGGTKLRMMNETQSSMFKNICHVIQCSEMVKNGYWTPIQYRSDSVNTTMLKLKDTGTEYTEETMNEFLQENKIARRIYDLCERLAKAKHILVFVDSIEFADELVKHIPNAVSIHSKLSDKDRDEYVAGFLSGKYRIAINVGVLAVGFDFPELEVIIHARPTNSVRIWYQTVGRIVRTHPNKPICLVYDISGNLKKFGKIEELVYVFDPRFGWFLRNASRILSSNAKIDAWRYERSITSSYAKYKMPRGKYIGADLLTIYERDKQYLEWIAYGEFTPTQTLGIQAKEIVMKYLC